MALLSSMFTIEVQESEEGEEEEQEEESGQLYCYARALQILRASAWRAYWRRAEGGRDPILAPNIEHSVCLHFATMLRAGSRSWRRLSQQIKPRQVGFFSSRKRLGHHKDQGLWLDSRYNSDLGSACTNLRFSKECETSRERQCACSPNVSSCTVRCLLSTANRAAIIRHNCYWKPIMVLFDA